MLENIENYEFDPLKMGHKDYCCVPGCGNRREDKSGLSFYSIPLKPHDRFESWMTAIGRGTDWIPTPHTRICSAHFVDGKKTNVPSHPAYNPTIALDNQKESESSTPTKKRRRKDDEKSGFSSSGILLDAATVGPTAAWFQYYNAVMMAAAQQQLPPNFNKELQSMFPQLNQHGIGPPMFTNDASVLRDDDDDETTSDRETKISEIVNAVENEIMEGNDAIESPTADKHIDELSSFEDKKSNNATNIPEDTEKPNKLPSVNRRKRSAPVRIIEEDDPTSLLPAEISGNMMKKTPMDFSQEIASSPHRPADVIPSSPSSGDANSDDNTASTEPMNNGHIKPSEEIFHNQTSTSQKPSIPRSVSNNLDFSINGVPTGKTVAQLLEEKRLRRSAEGVEPDPVPNVSPRSRATLPSLTPAPVQPTISTIWQDTHHVNTMTRYIERYWRDGMYTDIIINVEGESLPAHKLVLAACSSYITNLLASLPDAVLTIHLPGKKRAMKIIISFMYTGQLSLDSETVFDVLLAASLLMMERVKLMCERFIELHQLKPPFLNGLKDTAAAKKSLKQDDDKTTKKEDREVVAEKRAERDMVLERLKKRQELAESRVEKRAENCIENRVESKVQLAESRTENHAENRDRTVRDGKETRELQPEALDTVDGDKSPATGDKDANSEVDIQSMLDKMQDGDARGSGDVGDFINQLLHVHDNVYDGSPSKHSEIDDAALQNASKRKVQPFAYICSICHWRFPSETYCVKHILKRHPKVHPDRISQYVISSRYAPDELENEQNQAPGDAALPASVVAPESDEESVSCGVCGTTFNTIEQLTDHGNKYHKGNKEPVGDRFCCSLCNEKFTMHDECLEHITRKHPDVYSADDHIAPYFEEESGSSHHQVWTKFVCRGCQAKFPSHQLCREHCLSCPKTDARRLQRGDYIGYQCNHCDFYTPKKRYLPFHEHYKHGIPLPSSISYIKCPVCGRKCMSNSDLAVHMSIHGEKVTMHRCEVCNSSFTHAAALRTHVRARHMKEFACEQCSFRTKCARKFKNHMTNSHGKKAGGKMFSCTLCSFEGPSSLSLRVHVGKVHNIIGFELPEEPLARKIAPTPLVA